MPVSPSDDGVITEQQMINIELGSAFASELGFPASITEYVETEDESVVSIQQSGSNTGSAKKKKKKSKKKKGKK